MKSILKKPILTEKVTAMNEAGVYGFVVETNANKIEIKKAVEQKYGVVVEEVRTMRYAGKTKTRYTKRNFLTGKRPDFKKAMVTLKAGEVIDIYDNI